MGTLIISSGVVSSGLTADSTSDIIVLGGGTLTDSIATDNGIIYIDSDYTNPETNVHGGMLQRITASGGDVWVFNYGSASEITADNNGYFYIVEGGLTTGLVKSGGNGLVYDGATADLVTVADGGKFYNLGGTVRDTAVLSGGSFVVQSATAETSGTTVLTGGVMRITAAGKATDTTVNGGFLEIESGSAIDTVVSDGSMRVNKSNTVDGVTLIDGRLEINEATANATVVSGGSMRVSSGGIAQGTVVNDGILEIGSASGSGTVVNGGTMLVTYAGSIQDTTLNAGQLEVVSAAAANTTILTGTAHFTGATVSELNIGTAGIAAMDSASILTGKAAFEEGACITISGGTVAFDTALTTAETAQITGFSAVADSADAAYTLTVAEAEDIKGTYLLATDAAEFRGTVAFGEYTLELYKEAVFVDGLYYMLSLNETKGLVLSITEEPPVRPTPTLVYVNDEWTGLAENTVVSIDAGTATIGYDAFATADEAVAFIGGDTSVSRNLTFLSGGNAASFLGFDSVTLNADSLVTLAGAYTGTSITIDATGYENFTRKVMIAEGGYAPEVTISVLGDGFGYQFLEDGVTLLVTSDIVGDTFANTDWTESDVTGQFIGDVALVWNKNAFNSFAKAAGAIGYNGTLYLEGGTASEAVVLSRENDVIISGNTTGTATGNITGDGGAFTVGTAFSAGTISGFSFLTVEAGSVTVSGSIGMTKDGILNFDLTNVGAGNPDALVNDISLVTGSPAYTVTATGTEAVGSYKLAGNAADFDKTVSVKDTHGTTLGTLTVDQPEKIGERYYTLGITDNNELALAVSTYIPPTQTYVNSEWAGTEPGTVIVAGKTFGYNAFADLASAIEAVTSDGSVEVVGGTVSFADGYSKTITVDAGATVVGKATFDKAITVNGTFAFDTANASATVAQFGGFSNVAGSATCTLTDAAAATGTYLLASDAATFSSDVTFGTYTLKVGETVTVGEALDYTLGITDNNDLALTIAAYVPPTKKAAKSDIDGNGVSDVMFVWTQTYDPETGELVPGNYQHGYWMNGTSEWQSANCGHPANWDNLGNFDMTGDGKADSVLFGNVDAYEVPSAYIGYYKDGIDTDDNWVTIGFLTNVAGIAWQNKVGNMTGNASGVNSIAWYAPELGAVGVWTDGTENWVQLNGSFFDGWTLAGIGDFSGDGKDTVVMSYNGGQYLYTVGIGDEAPTSLGSANWSGWELRAIGDFSGDGKDDIILFHKEFGAMAMLVDGNADNYVSIGQLDAKDWFIVGAGDYNGDQKDDLLVRQYSTGMLGYYVSADQSQWVELGRGVDMQWTVIA